MRWSKIVYGIVGGLAIAGLCYLHEVTTPSKDVSAEILRTGKAAGHTREQALFEALQDVVNTDGSFTSVNIDSGSIDNVGIDDSPVGSNTANTGKFTSLATTVVTTVVDDATPDVSGGNMIRVGSNTTATEITDLDNAIAGQVIIIITTGGANFSTITNAGNFTLASNWTPDSGSDTITLVVIEDNHYVQVGSQTNNIN